MMRSWVGIDNGQTGAIAVIREDRVVVGAEKMPLVKLAKGVEVDGITLRERLAAMTAGTSPFVILERAGKFTPGRLALCSTWEAQGITKAVLALEGYSFMCLDAQKWQKELLAGLGTGDTKSGSIAAARRLFPGFSLVPPGGRVDHDGLADALLIAEYGRRHNL